jgi:uncharacterized protein (TIGR02246 family)
MTDSTADVEIRRLYTELLRAWNERDAERYAALFAGDGMVIGFDGSQATGEQIKAHLLEVFGDHQTAAYVGKVRQVRPLGSDGIVLRAISGLVPPGQGRLNPAVNSVQTLVAERQEGDWRIVLFQNTPAQYHGRPELTEQHTAELQPLVDGGTTVS